MSDRPPRIADKPAFPRAHVPRSAGEEIAVLSALLARPWAADVTPRAWFKQGPSRWLRDWLARDGVALRILDALNAAGVPVPVDGDAEPTAVAGVIGDLLQAEFDALPDLERDGPAVTGRTDHGRRRAFYDMRWLVRAVHGAATLLPELRREGLGTLDLLETCQRPSMRPRREDVRAVQGLALHGTPTAEAA